MSVPYSRRTFLKRLGVGTAGALGAATAIGPVLQGSAATTDLSAFLVNTFGRIFPSLPPFATPSPALQAALLDIGKPGGILDAQDNLSDPIALITNPSLSANNPDNLNHTAGTTFMGQFMDHDMTFDATSTLGVPTDPQATQNQRTPSFDLDSVYGRGPIADPQLYDPTDRVKFRVESGGLFEDLPRTAGSVAVIGDPRNDENLMIAGLHCAALLFHNHAVDYVRARGTRDPVLVFLKARALTTWHNQWMILHEFLPLFVGQAMVDDILTNGRRYYRPSLGRAFMPVEFQGASYRFGHSMVRPSYRANLKGDNGGPFFGFIFDPSQEGAADPNDLRGGARAPRRFIGWQTFFDFADGQVKHNKQIDSKISTPLFNLPLSAIASHTPPTALPQRNLLRQVTWSMPSGQSIAQTIGAPSLSATDLSELSGYGLGLEQSTPLWYYVLKEAQLTANGLHLGPVGGRIVGEVIIGLLQSDLTSYLVLQPNWKPTLPSRYGPGEFHMVDFLTFAGVDPASRGQ